VARASLRGLLPLGEEVALRSGSLLASLAVAAFASLAFMPLSCTVQQPPQSTSYFSQTISPILTAGCVRANTGSGCHVADPKGNSFGNLDLSTFDGINRRRDLLQTYGPYPRPALLLKNIPNLSVAMQTFDGKSITVTTDIKHVGGQILNPIDTAYSTLLYWINNGATEFNTGPAPNTLFHYPCTDIAVDMSVAPFNQSTFDPTKIDTSSSAYKLFTASNGPASIIKSTCGSGNCHGTASNELYFLCGNTQQQLEWNFFTASQYISNPPRDSEILRRPLDPTEGGSFHEGGVIFQGPSDPNYVAFLNWALAVGPASFPDASANLTFFADRVQPMLVKKGCMMMQCHSAAMFHDYRLRGGSGGSFSYAATLKNYELSLEQLGVDSPDFNTSRIAQKNLFRPQVVALPIATEIPGQDSGPPPSMAPQPLGILHRGGPLFEDFGTNGPSECTDATGWQAALKASVTNPNVVFPSCCPPTGTAPGNASYDLYQSATTTNPADIPIYAYCMFKEWHARERLARGLTPMGEIVYIKRPPQVAPDRAQDFDVFAGNAQLHIAQATIVQQPVTWNTTTHGDPAPVYTYVNGVDYQAAMDTNVDLTKLCGLAAGADVRRPMVSWDGTKFAFAARSTASDPLAVYEMNAQGTTCTKLPLNNVTLPAPCAGASTAMIHNFDPAYDADGSIVFASTRGNLAAAQGNFSYCGPQFTPADPSKPNANLYRYDPSSRQTTQLTYLLNMERHPSFMVDGRVIFTTEKREPNFYQLALRRQNLDTGDYHPLYAQRGSIGYYQADHVVEMGDKSFAAIFSTCNPSTTAGTAATCAVHGGGALGTFNRSIGVDFTSTNPANYPIDPTVIIPSSPSAPEPSFFLHSLSIPPEVSHASGTPGQVGNLYTTPSALPGGALLISRSTAPADPGTFNGMYDLYVVEPLTGAESLLIAGDGMQIVEAVGVYPRFVRPAPLPPVFASALDEPNGHTSIVAGQTTSDVTYLDAQVLSSLLFQNTPTGRLIDPGLTSFDLYEDLPPNTGGNASSTPPSTYVAQDDFGTVWVQRRLLGTVTANSASDPSAHVTLPGGVPMVIHLPDTPLSTAEKLPRWQREEIEYAPGEVENQVLPNAFFNGMCGQCHSAISGRAIDVAVQPDMLSQASNVAARTASAQNLNIAPASRSKMYVPVGTIQ
jgi:hypothetical protein